MQVQKWTQLLIPGMLLSEHEMLILTPGSVSRGRLE
jgi:hypothetical protein